MLKKSIFIIAIFFCAESVSKEKITVINNPNYDDLAMNSGFFDTRKIIKVNNGLIPLVKAYMRKLEESDVKLNECVLNKNIECVIKETKIMQLKSGTGNKKLERVKNKIGKVMPKLLLEQEKKLRFIIDNAKKGDLEGVKSSYISLRKTCNNCHRTKRIAGLN